MIQKLQLRGFLNGISRKKKLAEARELLEKNPQITCLYVTTVVDDEADILGALTIEVVFHDPP